MSAESYIPKAGFMGEKEEVDTFGGEPVEVLPDDIDKFSKKQYVQVEYVELEDEDERWTLAVLES